MASDPMTWFDWAQVVSATAGVVIAGLVAFMPYVRRPRLSIEEDLDRANSRVEMSVMGGMPHVRLLVANDGRRRAAQGTRVLVEGYMAHAAHAATLTTLGHPSLDWPSTGEAAATGAVTVFAGGARPITLGYFIRVRRDATGALLRPTLLDDEKNTFLGPPHYARDEDYVDGASAWYLRLALAWGLDMNDDRDKLPPVEDGYRIQLLVGADDGAARRFHVVLDWDGDPTRTPQQVLASALNNLSVIWSGASRLPPALDSGEGITRRR
jgi:hypothetical protein